MCFSDTNAVFCAGSSVALAEVSASVTTFPSSRKKNTSFKTCYQKYGHQTVVLMNW